MKGIRRIALRVSPTLPLEISMLLTEKIVAPTS